VASLEFRYTTKTLNLVQSLGELHRRPCLKGSRGVFGCAAEKTSSRGGLAVGEACGGD
jgi:hypothetical protein